MERKGASWSEPTGTKTGTTQRVGSEELMRLSKTEWRLASSTFRPSSELERGALFCSAR